MSISHWPGTNQSPPWDSRHFIARIIALIRLAAAKASAAPDRTLIVAGLIAALVLALCTTTRHIPVPPAEIERQMNAQGDVYHIFVSASKASWRDIPRWFAGSWIYEGCGYYRPLTSILFLFEHHAFHRDFTAYNTITWIMHGVNACLIYLLVVSLLGSHPRMRFLYGLIAVWFFAAPANSMNFAIAASIQWWPAQNDPLSLMFGLTSLILLDRYLLAPKRFLLAGSVAAMVCAIGAKEVGHMTMPLAVALIFYRKRILWREMFAFAVPSISLFIFRRIVVPNHWEPELWKARAFDRAADYLGGPLVSLAKVGEWWALIAGFLVVAIVILGVKKRARAHLVASVCLLAAGLCAQFIGAEGTWALLLDQHSQVRLGSTIVFLSAIYLFWHYRRSEPGAISALWMITISISVMGYVGYHYYYWPSAMLAVADAMFAACLVRAVREYAVVQCLPKAGLASAPLPKTECGHDP